MQYRPVQKPSVQPKKQKQQAQPVASTSRAAPAAAPAQPNYPYSTPRTSSNALNNASQRWITDPAHHQRALHILEEREHKRNQSSRASIPTGTNHGTFFLENAYSIKDAFAPDARQRSRWPGQREPYDKNRVRFPPGPEGEDRFLNASWVREIHGGRWWIAAEVRHRSNSNFSGTS